MEKSTKKLNLFAINYALQEVFYWGGKNWKFKETDLKEVAKIVDLENSDETGEKIWAWFYNWINKKMFTFNTTKNMGKTFIESYNKFLE